VEWLLSALAHAKLNEVEQAKQLYDRAIDWLKDNEADALTHQLAVDALRQFEGLDRHEAHNVLAGFDDSRQLAQLAAAIEAAPEDASVWRARGQWYACRGMWSKAADDQIAAIDLNPENWEYWMAPAAMLVLAGEHDEYRGLCRRMAGQFENTSNPMTADVVCKTHLLLPDESDLPSLPVGVLIDALDRDAFPRGMASWGIACRALAEYRAGRVGDAVRFVHEARKRPRYTPCEALSLLILCMAKHRLDDRESARLLLNQAQLLIPAKLARLKMSPGEGRLPVIATDVHHDWLIAEVLRREAVALINPASPPPVTAPAKPVDGRPAAT
jgi:tetratricopeptide (TPR) repeat protein